MLGFGTTSTVQQVVAVTLPASNLVIAGLIGNPQGAIVRTVGPPHVSADTVYFYLTVDLPVDYTQTYPRQVSYELEIHYHPVPTTPNYLHVKVRAGTSAGNQVAPTHWLIDAARLHEGRLAWDAANPTNRSPHTF
jgi:hypothetical protein